MHVGETELKCTNQMEAFSDIVLSWSLDDIFNENLYKHQVFDLIKHNFVKSMDQIDLISPHLL